MVINLAHVRRFDLLGRLPGWRFKTTDEVVAEITIPAQQQQFHAALARGDLKMHSLHDPRELQLFTSHRRVVGKGEAACLAAAELQGWILGSDEKRKLRRLANKHLGPGRILTTPGLYVVAIRAGILAIEEADRDKQTLEAKRFKMAFSSFHDVVGPTGGQRA